MPTIALIIWPFVALAIFAKLGVIRGIIVATIWGYLFLPENFRMDLPGLPGYDKSAAVALGAALGVFFFRKTLPPAKPRPQRGFQDNTVRFDYIFFFLMALLFVGPLFTYWFNRFIIPIGPTTILPSMRAWDIVSISYGNIVMLAPFLLARRYLSTPDAHRKLLVALAVAGLAYSLLVLFERRMSPQLHTWIYGYFQHSFIQHVRGGGYRPIVFLRHGLWVGFFLFSTVIAAAVLYKDKGADRRRMMFFLAIWLFLVLAVSRNLAALLIAMIFVPAILFRGPRFQATMAAIVAIIFLMYPGVRQANLIPLDRVLAAAEAVSVERMESLKIRLDNEDALLAHALKKPVFGWGGWNRSRIHDPETGLDITTADGIWIITLGTFGWVKYIGLFGLLCIPMVLLGRRKYRDKIEPATAGMVIIMAGNLIYLVPNSALSPIGWLIGGALSGYVRQCLMIGDEDEDLVDVESDEGAGAGSRAPGTQRNPLPYARNKLRHARPSSKA